MIWFQHDGVTAQTTHRSPKDIPRIGSLFAQAHSRLKPFRILSMGLPQSLGFKHRPRPLEDLKCAIAVVQITPATLETVMRNFHARLVFTYLEKH